MKQPDPARIHLLPAKGSPYVLVIRRKPSKCFHIIRWNTKTDSLEHGTWFRGKIYPKRCDISFDGKWMIYLAMGDSGETWNGVSRLPYLRTVVEGSNTGSWFGGGYWRDQQTILLNNWQPSKGSVPFQTEQLSTEFGGEDLGVFLPRLERDGWVRNGVNYGTSTRVPSAKKYTIVCEGDDGWRWRPTPKHPFLSTRYVGYLEHGYTFRFALDDYNEVIDDDVDSACWDFRGNLVFSRAGILYKLSLSDLKNRLPGTQHDLENLVPRWA